ncbi:MAG: hypothetical protein AB1815_02655 [Bacillota bacterium]
MNYNFPATRFATENTRLEQFRHIMSEMEEAQEANDVELDEEVMDILHSCETYFRMREAQGIDVGKIKVVVEAKNMARGYYQKVKPND